MFDSCSTWRREEERREGARRPNGGRRRTAGDRWEARRPGHPPGPGGTPGTGRRAPGKRADRLGNRRVRGDIPGHTGRYPKATPGRARPAVYGPPPDRRCPNPAVWGGDRGLPGPGGFTHAWRPPPRRPAPRTGPYPTRCRYPPRPVAPPLLCRLPYRPPCPP